MGAGLLRDGIATAEAGGEDIHLETGRQTNVAYYERFGFALVAPGAPLWPGGPTLWRMRRPRALGGVGNDRPTGDR